MEEEMRSNLVGEVVDRRERRAQSIADGMADVQKSGSRLTPVGWVITGLRIAVIWLEVGTDRKPADGDAVGAINKCAWSQCLGEGNWSGACFGCSWDAGSARRGSDDTGALGELGGIKAGPNNRSRLRCRRLH
jgi:hypothetical protein